jgi:hypothetical protein
MKARTSNHKPTHDQIAQRAYALFEQSGRVPGHDQENWLRAERELSVSGKEEEKNNGRIATSPAPRQLAGSRA